MGGGTVQEHGKEREKVLHESVNFEGVNDLSNFILKETAARYLKKDETLAALSLAIGVYLIANFPEKEWKSAMEIVKKTIDIGAKYKLATMMRVFEE